MMLLYRAMLIKRIKFIERRGLSKSNDKDAHSDQSKHTCLFTQLLIIRKGQFLELDKIFSLHK